jgi:hypothetical protein
VIAEPTKLERSPFVLDVSILPLPTDKRQATTVIILAVSKKSVISALSASHKTLTTSTETVIVPLLRRVA